MLVRCAMLRRYLSTALNFNNRLKNQILLTWTCQFKIRNQIHISYQSARHEAENSNATTTNNEEERLTAGMSDVLHEKLNCSQEWAQHFCTTYSKSLNTKCNLLESIDLLFASGVRTNVILDNPKMLTIRDKRLAKSLSIVKDMDPININDFAPLVQCSTTKLMELKKTADSEKNVVPKNHRIYYISEAMNIEPCTITKFVSNRLFVLTDPFHLIDENLQVLLKYIAPIDLLHDLWAFRYKPAVIEERLNRARDGNKEKLMPWMIRCTEKKLSTSIKIASDAKAIVGNRPLVEYLSERLKYSVKATETIMQRHPSVFNCRVTRMKATLDYLFGAGFVAVDIAQTPKVFSYSLKTIKIRVEELKSIGCQPELFVVCRSSTEYNKFVENWIRIRDKLKQKNIIKE